MPTAQGLGRHLESPGPVMLEVGVSLNVFGIILRIFLDVAPLCTAR